MSTKPEPPAPSPDLDPLEIALQEREAVLATFGSFGWKERGQVAAIRVLKRGHEPHRCQNPDCEAFGAPTPHGGPECRCGKPWPCPTLAEAARALRGERE